jgi:hypothetical protein
MHQGHKVPLIEELPQFAPQLPVGPDQECRHHFKAISAAQGASPYCTENIMNNLAGRILMVFAI